MRAPLSRRRFIGLTAAGVLGVGGYGLVRGVQKVRDAARHLSDV